MITNSDLRAVPKILSISSFLYFSILVWVLLELPIRNSFVPDSGSYFDPAVVMSNGGQFSSVFRLPLYPYFLRMFIDNSTISSSIILIQFILCFLTSLMIRKISLNYFPRIYSDLVFSLTLLSPPALYAGICILPDAMFSFLLMLCVFVVHTLRDRGLSAGLLSGVVIGLLSLLRGNGLYVFPAFILYFLSRSLLVSRSDLFVKYIFSSAISIVLIVAPYKVYVEDTNNNADAYKNFVISENVIYANAFIKSMNIQSSTEDVMGIIGPGVNKASLTKYDRHRLIANNAFRIFHSYSPFQIIKGLSKASFAFFFSNGFSSLAQVLGKNSITITSLAKDFGYGIPLIIAFIKNPYSLLAVFFVSLSLIVKAFGLYGLVSLYRDRFLSQFILIVSLILTFWVVSGFLGYSRYRLPVEPLFMFLGIYGVRKVMISLSKEKISKYRCDNTN